MEVFFEVGKRDEMTTDALTMLLYSSLGHFTPMSCSQTRKVRRERERNFGFRQHWKISKKFHFGIILERSEASYIQVLCLHFQER